MRVSVIDQPRSLIPSKTMSSASASEKKILLRSSDGKMFELEEMVALQMLTIKHMIEDNCVDQEIPIPNVTSSVLSKVIEYCKKHVEACDGESEDSPDELPELLSRPLSRSELRELNEYSKKHPKKQCRKFDLKAWDTEFVKVDHSTLFDLILAANYLNIKSLLDLTCGTVGDMIKGRTPSEIRKIFNIKNEFTPEEEEEVRRQNSWAFE